MEIIFSLMKSGKLVDFFKRKTFFGVSGTLNRPDLQTFTYCIKNYSKSCESQARSPHRFTSK